MTLTYIDLKEPNAYSSARITTLSISDKTPNVLCVVGGLSHGAEIRPATWFDAERLRTWLNVQYPPKGNQDEVIRALRSALERTNNRLAAAVANHPIRDYAETVGECEHAMELSKQWSVDNG